MGHPHSSDKRARVAAALAGGRPLAEVAREFGIKESTARLYKSLARQKIGTVREAPAVVKPRKSSLPRCACMLLLPCTCGGRLRAEQFLRSNE